MTSNEWMDTMKRLGNYIMTMTMTINDNEIALFRHHNGNNTNIKVIFKQVTMLDKCNCI